MFDIFEKKEKEEFPTKSQTFYQIFLCYFDEAMGHLPLYTFPSELKYDENELRIIKIHSIWFLDAEAQEDLSHVDLDYGDKQYLAMKFKGKSWRSKSRAGIERDTPETYVLIISLPREYSFLGSDLLISLYSKIKELADSLYILIKAEIASKRVIKTDKDKNKGDNAARQAEGADGAEPGAVGLPLGKRHADGGRDRENHMRAEAE